MRPRFANRGSLSQPAQSIPIDLASMRPRFANRGSAHTRRSVQGGFRCFNEAPIRESGKFRCARLGAFGRVASMRPRFANRGSSQCNLDPGIRPKASMRPRFANRGSDPLSPRTRAHRRGFNEAPIRESGKWFSEPFSRPFSARASMRPRFANRGSRADPGRCRRAKGRFNEAPIRESGKYHTLYQATGWTHGFNEAPIRESGKSDLRVHARPARLASMRPRFANRGSVPLAQWLTVGLQLQ